MGILYLLKKKSTGLLHRKGSLRRVWLNTIQVSDDLSVIGNNNILISQSIINDSF